MAREGLLQRTLPAFPGLLLSSPPRCARSIRLPVPASPLVSLPFTLLCFAHPSRPLRSSSSLFLPPLLLPLSSTLSIFSFYLVTLFPLGSPPSATPSFLLSQPTLYVYPIPCPPSRWNLLSPCVASTLLPAFVSSLALARASRDATRPGRSQLFHPRSAQALLQPRGCPPFSRCGTFFLSFSLLQLRKIERDRASVGQRGEVRGWLHPLFPSTSFLFPLILFFLLDISTFSPFDKFIFSFFLKLYVQTRVQHICCVLIVSSLFSFFLFLQRFFRVASFFILS